MPPKFLWDDDDFTVQIGVIPGQTRLFGTDLGPGIIYCPVYATLTDRLRTRIQIAPRPSATGLSCFWNTGAETEIFNPHDSSVQFIRVALKPSSQLAAEFPQDFL